MTLTLRNTLQCNIGGDGSMLVKEIANLSGVSVRTLHYYDQIGLLKPTEVTAAGYRIYIEKDLVILQQILFFKEIGFPLKEIKLIIYNPDFNEEVALKRHLQAMLEKRNRMNQVIETIEKTIKYNKGEIHMTDKEKFTGFDLMNNPYEQEARARWGDLAIDATKQKLTKDDSGKRGEAFNAIYKELAKLRHEAEDSEQAQIAIGKWFDYLNQIGNYSLEAFKGLGQIYVEDVRFKQNIDQYGEGLALFMCKAMGVYADSYRKG